MRNKTANTSMLDALLREAENKLGSAGRKGKTLHTLPMLYLLGDTNAAKTTAVLRTDWNAELIAGEAMRDGEVCPTSTLNLWFADGVLLAETGAALNDSPAQRRRLFAKTRPGSWRTSFRGDAPLRAAVVCVSCERLLGANAASELAALAAKTGEQLRELAKFLGTAVPVYVLFTKADRIPFFAAWVRNLSTDEASLLLGAAPRDFSVRPGSTWAETASATILQSYDGLLSDLQGTRLPLLARETDGPVAAENYEFPREMRKLRNSLSAFLIELVRPSQLHASPLLRGFYFTGVRAHMVEQIISEAAATPKAIAQQDAGATRIFSALSAQQGAASADSFAPRTSSKKTAQWTFLPRFFPQAVLRDAAALAGSGTTRQASLFQRFVYGTAAALLLLLLIAFTVSYSNNHTIEKQLNAADQQLAHNEAVGGANELAAMSQLEQLDILRSHLVQLEQWQREGAPLGYRWGLYHGNTLLAPARRLYFEHFRALLLTRTQNNLIAELGGLPATPPQNADYNSTYEALRGYLITTSYPQYSTSAFLAPVLTNHWQNGATISSEHRALAQRQFAFYADELTLNNPYSIRPVDTSVNQARTYLAGFGGFERIYQSILTAASRQTASIDFNAQFPHSAETILEPHIVLGAFTPSGYTFMQNALAHPEVYFRGEAWVLGDKAPATIDTGSLKQQLTTRYDTDYITTWRAFLDQAHVVKARSLAEAGTKLGIVSGTNSPLLALIQTASYNTSVQDKSISDAFQAPQTLVPPANKDQYLTASNKNYVDGLLTLRSSIQQVTASPSGALGPAAAAPIASAASAAHLAAQQTAQAFHIDAQAHTDAVTLALMEAPITSADALLRGLGPAEANAGSRSFCSVVNGLFSKFPFNPASSVQATPAEVTAVLQPNSGELWQFYNTNLKSLLVQQGTHYSEAPNPPIRVNPAFLRFFNRAADLSAAFFPAGATAPSLTFTLHNLPSNGVQKATLKVDSQTLALKDPPKQFTWQAANAANASLTANDLPLTFTGVWAVFEMLDKGKIERSITPNTYDLSFALELANTPVRAPDGTPIVVDYELSGPGASVLAPGSMSGLRCVDSVAR
ncbi:ImcF-related family protein [Granulicella mallensis]|uniref:ImcF domain protein n=1 Tax=Granulicella mallensis (strain ATCC BAA-1857 / DSM 23137 / MP5ACTX8) TaxID=682795 RepID=G8NPU7_GRAMM|nr:ImcF-related family protein [Granulicella mallensis]AEU37186.1 ImcF domain protein [Granulicella mallensis MP5ACTX8]